MLLTFEGIDGSGKSTQARLLKERLEAEGEAPLLLREPGGTDLSERVRTLLLDPALHIEPFAELLLFSAARAQLVAEQIRPALAAGRIVLCDRFYDSTTAYQGSGRAVADWGWIRDFNQHVTGNLVPDRTYLVELDPKQAQARRAERQGAGNEDRMEAAGLAFQQRVAEAYHQLARAEPERFYILDGTQSIASLHAQIWADLQQGRARNTGME
ncbi:MAG TPA: dTMP kinase [Rhodothermales bacterium]|nr:dTMP kinase [Rhodothermales bacterium]